MSETHILAPLDIAHLTSQGLVGPVDDGGTRRLHKRRLNRSSDEEHGHIPLQATVHSHLDAFATIPDQLISLATIEHVGFSKTKALEIWNSWTNWPVTGPRRETDIDDGGLQVTFLDFLTEHIGRVDTHDDNDVEWTSCMETYGLATEAQHAILDVRFKYLRLSRSCAEWSADTVHMRYAGLEEIQKASRDRAAALRCASSRPGNSQASRSSSDNVVSTPDTLSTSSSSRPTQRSISSMQRESVPGISTDSSSSSIAIAERDVPGYTVLYKGLDQGRIVNLLDDAGRLNQIEALLSPPPSDFSGTRSLFYFTPDFKVAEYYAAYAKRRANVESVVIVRIAIPDDAIWGMEEGEIQRVYWPSREWKELVWYSRRQQRLPSTLRKYRDATLVIGTISKKPERVYHRLKSWEGVSESHVLKVDREHSTRKAVQFVFSGEEGQDFLVKHASDNIKVYPFTQGEMGNWLEQDEV
ncbi:hypothetical protein FALBO_6803 [Fusarium albosuccineum]|uniref:Uncharacterized protein n=1 Tax=Fusarium albosuccineum TaxID=1237068 RepID=A0A8H4LE76_9HYPO|nr:hypothetical protein FALBO_6803 [Fusarium albosuccineum]